MMPAETPLSEALLQEAQDPQTSAVHLKEICDEVGFGQMPFFYAETRSEVRFSIAEAVALHPNTPPELLRTLAKPFPQAVLSNPVLPLLLLEDPGWIHSLQPDTVLSLLRFENVPPAMLSAFAAVPDLLGSFVRLHVGLAGEAGPDWKEEVQEALWELTRLQFLSNELTAPLLTLDFVPDWLLEPLAADGDAEVRWEVARHPHTPPDVLTLLRRAGSTPDLSRFAPPDLSLPASALEWLASGGNWAQSLAARHPNTPPEVLGRLAARMLANPNLWGDSLWVMKSARRSLMRNLSTPAPRREELAQAAAVASEALEAKRREQYQWKTPHDRWMMAQDLNTSPDTLTSLAEDRDPRIQLAVGLNAAADVGALARLANDPAREVRLAAAHHPQTPPFLLGWLADDDAEEVRQAAAHHLEVLWSAEAARNQGKPDVSPDVWAQALDEATEDENRVATVVGISQTVVLACPDTPPKLLVSRANSAYWVYRLAVAQNPVMLLVPPGKPGSEDTLHVLACDGNRFVRAAAREALQKRKTLEKREGSR